MNNVIKCIHCGKDIKLSDALSHELSEEREKIRKATEDATRKKVQLEFDEKQKIQQKEYEQKEKEREKELEEERKKAKKLEEVDI